MIVGLQMMDDKAKCAFAEELQLPKAEGAELDRALISWMGQAVGLSSSASDDEIELAVLQWFAGKLGLVDYLDLSVDKLEAAVRRRVAEDSHDFLFPFMEVGSAVAYLGPKKVVGPKLEFLEASTAGIIPSHSARDRMRQYWQSRGAQLLSLQEDVQAHSLLQYLEEPLSILKHGSEATRASVYTLCHAVALSDGRFETEEEQFATLLAQELELSTEKVDEITKEFGQAFWNHLSDLGGGTYGSQRSTGEELGLTLRAAQLALESCGSLASFSAVVERGFVGSLHSAMGTGTTVSKAMKNWGKTPLRLPLGFATGMLCYIRDKWKADDHENLLRLTLASIYRQHLSATADHAEIGEEDVDGYIQESTVENPAEVLAETVVGTVKQEPVRKITLDRMKFEEP